MHSEFHRLMQGATRLVRAGDLRAATASIQAALHAQPAGGSTPVEMPGAPGIVIDVKAREVDRPPLRREHALEEPATAA